METRINNHGAAAVILRSLIVLPHYFDNVYAPGAPWAYDKCGKKGDTRMLESNGKNGGRSLSITIAM